MACRLFTAQPSARYAIEPCGTLKNVAESVPIGDSASKTEPEIATLEKVRV